MRAEVDRAAKRIADALNCGTLVNLGGDIAVAGEPPDQGWLVGIVDNRDLMMENGGRGLLIRDPSSGRETRRRELAEIVEYGSQTKDALATRLSGGPWTGRDLTEAAGFLAAAEE